MPPVELFAAVTRTLIAVSTSTANVSPGSTNSTFQLLRLRLSGLLNSQIASQVQIPFSVT